MTAMRQQQPLVSSGGRHGQTKVVHVTRLAENGLEEMVACGCFSSTGMEATIVTAV